MKKKMIMAMKEKEKQKHEQDIPTQTSEKDSSFIKTAILVNSNDKNNQNSQN
jgi:hypothetical protein